MTARKTTARRKPTRTALRQELRRLSRRFADELFETLERYGIWDERGRRAAEISTGSRGGARRVRRTEQDLASACEAVLAALRAEKQPAAISTIAERMGSSARQIAHPLALLVAQGRIIKSGERRGTRYAPVPSRARRPTSRPRSGRQAKARPSKRPSRR